MLIDLKTYSLCETTEQTKVVTPKHPRLKGDCGQHRLFCTPRSRKKIKSMVSSMYIYQYDYRKFDYYEKWAERTKNEKLPVPFTILRTLSVNFTPSEHWGSFPSYWIQISDCSTWHTIPKVFWARFTRQSILTGWPGGRGSRWLSGEHTVYLGEVSVARW